MFPFFVLLNECNSKTVNVKLFLSSLSDHQSNQLILFLTFPFLYIITLIGNLLILFIIITDTYLHSPVYFFLGNLVLLDLCCSSITTPRMLSDLNTRNHMVSLSACITQIYFFISFATSEITLLAVMSYSRHVAVCYPLHYMQRMTWKACVQLAMGVWLLGFLYSLLLTLFTMSLTFCDSNTVHSFFCDLTDFLH
ncbi:hypothetical protein XENTR_v10012689 [Xenopus tropicalis]|nr:hypothetical protein XENTR_v10012689 [Xenopus tropicalis]